MINRRLLRIKVLQVAYSYLKSDDRSYSSAENEFKFSLNKAYELYHLLLQLIPEYTHLASLRADKIENNPVHSKEDLPAYKAIANSHFAKQVFENIALEKYLHENNVSWADNNQFVKKSFRNFIESDHFKLFLESDLSYQHQKKVFSNFMEEYLLESEELISFLEDKSIFWNDDLDFMLSMVLKTIRRMEENSDKLFKLLPMYKNDDDKEFAEKLFKKSISNFTKHDQMLSSQIKTWKLERLADIDMLIIKLAITEAIEFPSIPLKVTINEYLEIAKYYSTEKSNLFINGILESVFSHLQDEKVIVKKGRGLLE